MAYNYQYINYLRQYNVTQYTLIITDTDNIIPDYRVDKMFDVPEEDITEEYLASAALGDIEAMVLAYEQGLIDG